MCRSPSATSSASKAGRASKSRSPQSASEARSSRSGSTFSRAERCSASSSHGPTSTVDIGSEDMLYESLNRLEKETNITVFLITHDIHIVSQYSDAVLALNRTVRFFGASSRFSEPGLLMEIFGSGAGLAEHKHDFGAREFR